MLPSTTKLTPTDRRLLFNPPLTKLMIIISKHPNNYITTSSTYHLMPYTQSKYNTFDSLFACRESTLSILPRQIWGPFLLLILKTLSLLYFRTTKKNCPEELRGRR